MKSMWRVLTLVSLVAVFACAGNSNCFADNTVPWLTGPFFGGTSVIYELGTGVSTGVPVVNLTNGLGMQVSVVANFTGTSTDFVETPLVCSDQSCNCPPDGLCGWNFNGTFNGGNLVMSSTDANNNPLYLSGKITGGTFAGTYCFVAFGGNCGDIYFWETFDFSFGGVWSNSWHSVGELSGTYCTDISCNNGSMTGGAMITTTPELPSIVLLGPSVLGLATAIRLKMGR